MNKQNSQYIINSDSSVFYAPFLLEKEKVKKKGRLKQKGRKKLFNFQNRLYITKRLFVLFPVLFIYIIMALNYFIDTNVYHWFVKVVYQKHEQGNLLLTTSQLLMTLNSNLREVNKAESKDRVLSHIQILHKYSTNHHPPRPGSELSFYKTYVQFLILNNYKQRIVFLCEISTTVYADHQVMVRSNIGDDGYNIIGIIQFTTTLIINNCPPFVIFPLLSTSSLVIIFNT